MTIEAYMRRLPKEIAQTLLTMDSAILREFAKKCVLEVSSEFQNVQNLSELIDDLDWNQNAFTKARAATAMLVLREESDPLLSACRIAYEIHAALDDWTLIERVINECQAGCAS